MAVADQAAVLEQDGGDDEQDACRAVTWLSTQRGTIGRLLPYS
jgi:hypothetical protein